MQQETNNANFTNLPVDVNSLPQFQNVDTHKVNKKLLWVLILSSFVTFIILISIIVILTNVVEQLKQYRFISLLIVCLIFAAYILLIIVSFNNRSYAIRTQDIMYKHGILSRLTTVIPLNRIQHIAINEGVFLRMFGLAQLQIFTAGSGLTDLKLSGITKEDAEKFRELIINKIGIK